MITRLFLHQVMWPAAQIINGCQSNNHNTRQKTWKVWSHTKTYAKPSLKLCMNLPMRWCHLCHTWLLPAWIQKLCQRFLIFYMGPIASPGGFVPVYLRTHIATYDFPGRVWPLYSPSGPVHELSLKLHMLSSPMVLKVLFIVRAFIYLHILWMQAATKTLGLHSLDWVLAAGDAMRNKISPVAHFFFFFLNAKSYSNR